MGTIRVRPDAAMRAARPGRRRVSFVGWGRAIALAATAIVLLRAGGACACDDFAAPPSSRWSVAAGETGPVLLTPCGDPFFSLGINAIDGGAAADALPPSTPAYRWDRHARTRAKW